MTDAERNDYNWTSVDAAELTNFLKTQTGVKLLRALAIEEPPLLRKGDTNEILIRSGEVSHHKHLLSFLLTLTGEIIQHQDEDTKQNPYPSLTDDEAWEGPKLNEPQ